MHFLDLHPFTHACERTGVRCCVRYVIQETCCAPVFTTVAACFLSSLTAEVRLNVEQKYHDHGVHYQPPVEWDFSTNGTYL